MKDFNIPLLTAEDIDCRVQSVSKAKNGTVGAVLLLYKDARVDMRILDQVFGPGNWQRTHELINGNLFCTIEIWDDEKAAWVKKQDVGVESNTEKEKGQASDAFKRAGFNVGIGRELYSAPFTYVELNDGEWKVEKVQGRDVYRTYPNVKFSVTKIGYNDRREIVDLTIVDRFGNVRFLCEGGVQKKVNQGGQGSRQSVQSGRQAQTPPPAAQTSQATRERPRAPLLPLSPPAVLSAPCAAARSAMPNATIPFGSTAANCAASASATRERWCRQCPAVSLRKRSSSASL